MQQIQEWRALPRRLVGDRRQWFQLGMASATIMTPLVSRWRSLRAAERARTLWEASQNGTRWPWMRPPVSEESLPPLARREVRTGLWLAGVAVGLAAAGTAAFIIVRRRWHAEEEPLDVPLITRAGTDSPASTGIAAESAVASANITGGTETLASAAPATNGASGATHTPVEPPEPLFVGNTRTLQYRAADADNPPPEEVRIYFASEAQARQAGYRPAPGAPRTPQE